VPSKSQIQQIAMAIAEHNPSKLYKKNSGLKKMSHTQLHDFASTPRKQLVKRISKSKNDHIDSEYA
jgi:hypothetical protein